MKTQALLFFSYCSAISVLVPLIVFFRTRARIKITVFNYVYFVLIASLLSDVLSYAFIKAGVSSIPVNNLYRLLEMIILSLLFKDLLPRHREKIYVVLALFGLFFCIDAVWFESITEYQSNVRVFESATLIVYTYMYFSSLMKSPTLNIQSYGLFWITISISYYFSANLLLFGMGNFLLGKLPPEQAAIMWSFHSINNVVKNALFAIGIHYAGSKLFLGFIPMQKK